MTKEELFEKHKCVVGYSDNDVKNAIEDSYEQGMKRVCKICEKHLIEANPNAVGCAFRRLDNTYCWGED